MFRGVLRIAAAMLMVPLLAGAAPLSLDPLLVPVVSPGQTLSYSSVEFIGPPVNEVNRSRSVFRITRNTGGVMHFFGVFGESRTPYVRGTSGVLLRNDTPAAPIATFFLEQQFVGDPPDPLTPGASWDAQIPGDSWLGPAGIAHLTVMKIDRAARTLVLDLRMNSHGDSSGTSPGISSAVHYHTDSVRTATISLKDGIVQSFDVNGEDHQTASADVSLQPVTVRVKASFDLTK